MACLRVAFHESDRNRENDKNDEDNLDSYKQGVECQNSGNRRNLGIDENHGNPGCKPQVPQVMGFEIPDFLISYSFFSSDSVPGESPPSFGGWE